MSSDESSPKRISDIVERLAGLFADQGGDLYGGEAVTQLEHALQAAQLAEQEDCPSHEIVAALLHDVGHLIHDLGVIVRSVASMTSTSGPVPTGSNPKLVSTAP